MFTFFKNSCLDESVYALVPPSQDTRGDRPPLYRSRFSCKVREDAYCKKTGCAKTMGPAKTTLPNPCQFLKKNSKAPISTIRPAPRLSVVECVQVEEPPCPDDMGGSGDCKPCNNDNMDAMSCLSGDANTTDAICGSGIQETCCQPNCRPRVPRLCCNKAKPPVPNPCQGFDVIPRGNRNFVRNNALKAIRTPAKKPQPKFVDTKKGDVQRWVGSGFPREHVFKEGFGKVPEYIEKYKQKFRCQDQAKKQELCAHEREVGDKCRHLNEDERKALICGLKKNWDETFREFLMMPLSLDNPGKIKKKMELEEDLKQMEKDIQTLERHDHIFVGDAPRSFYLA